MKKLRYPEAERVLARMHNIEPGGIKTFRARLRHFRNLGVPEGVQIGRGKRPNYGWSEMLQMVLALELAEFDIAPVTIAQSIRMPGAREENERRCVAAMANKDSNYFIVLCPHWMEESFFGGGRASYQKFLELSQLQSEIEPFLGAEDRRYILINLSKTLNSLESAMKEEDRENGKHKKPKTKR